METFESKRQFADRCGVDKSTVSKWDRAGRLVLGLDGRVDIDASLHRLEATRGGRWDVAERWRAYRAEQQAKGQANGQAPAATETATETATGPQAATEVASAESGAGEGLDLDEIGRRTRFAQMLKEEAVARQKQREDDLAAGRVIRRADVQKDLTDAVAVILGAWENVPDRLAPLLVGIDDQTRIRALLRDEIERLGHEVAAQLAQVGDAHHGADAAAAVDQERAA